ncbi:MerR family transcriptional regulator [Pseudodesulfovibrio tunisiensis]|uniref:MerR family transcriptional regulator n=1 Tax=Pseudodesulfovibrio tunisiensis TaxID=463192 RepID=UPI001FB33DE0|nr:MerR family transcriptional regulator [Pseudodesulfovibrio tunisiensis]
MNDDLLTSMAQIKARFGVGRDRVLRWVRLGAPIAVEYTERGGQPRYSASARELQQWRARKFRAAEAV